MESITLPTLHKNRLTLVPIGAAHSLGVFNLWSNPDVCRYSGPVVDYGGNVLDTPCTTIDQSDKIIEFWEQAARDGWGFRWSILHLESGSATFMGIVGFNAISPVPEIAYHLHPGFWGKGYMLEATIAAIEWAKANLRSDRIEAFVEDENVRSIRLATRLGFVATGRYKERSQQYLLFVSPTTGETARCDQEPT